MARLLHTVAQRLRKHTKALGAFAAWNKCLGHLLALARAHIESVTFVRMTAFVEGCTDADCRKSLKVRGASREAAAWLRRMRMSFKGGCGLVPLHAHAFSVPLRLQHMQQPWAGQHGVTMSCRGIVMMVLAIPIER